MTSSPQRGGDAVAWPASSAPQDRSPFATTPLGLTPIANFCASGSCPTLYTTDRGTVVVQGYVVTSEQAGMSTPPGEALVEIPEELFTEVLRHYR